MKVNLKAALLSAFVLPGLGQLYKGNRLKGSVLLILANIFLLLALFLVLRGIGPLISAAMLSGADDPYRIANQIQQLRTPFVKWLLTIFSAIWLYAVIDAAIGGKGKAGADD
jgi:TM2 domain-containing membrane protein YozV